MKKLKIWVFDYFKINLFSEDNPFNERLVKKSIELIEKKTGERFYSHLEHRGNPIIDKIIHLLDIIARLIEINEIDDIEDYTVSLFCGEKKSLITFFRHLKKILDLENLISSNSSSYRNGSDYFSDPLFVEPSHKIGSVSNWSFNKQLNMINKISVDLAIPTQFFTLSHQSLLSDPFSNGLFFSFFINKKFNISILGLHIRPLSIDECVKNYDKAISAVKAHNILDRYTIDNINIRSIIAGKYSLLFNIVIKLYERPKVI